MIPLLFVLHFFNGACQQKSLAEAAMDLTNDQVTYDPAYFSISYPMGDIPTDKGVCTDVVIRAYRKIGVDLQQLVHEDMKANFRLYPNNWGLNRTDPNIDHRRVPNLMTFFERFGESKPNTNDVSDYRPGDIVCWDLGKGINHIGIVVAHHNGTEHRPLIVHNIGAGQVLQDFLFDYPIIGHFRFE
ncbi:MAG: DUF1287 domain-containing protein [Cytophagales bacterium]|nr:DUF1287 domain-containing protein [Cytophagales bacterium]